MTKPTPTPNDPSSLSPHLHPTAFPSGHAAPPPSPSGHLAILNTQCVQALRSGTVSSHHSLSLSLAASASAYVTQQEGDGEDGQEVENRELPSDAHFPGHRGGRRLLGWSGFPYMVVYGAVVPILPYIAAEKLHVDEASLGFLFASYALGLLLSTPPIAYLSDKWRNRKWPMFFGLAGLVCTTIIFALSTQYWQLLVARILQGFRQYLGSVIGPVLSCNHAGFLAGPVIGGWLFQYFGYAAPFYFSAGLAFANLLFRLVRTLADLVVDSYNTTSPAVIVTSPPSDQQQGMLSLLHGLPIQLCILVTIIVGGIFSGLEPTLPLHLHDTYNLTPSQIGTTFVSLVIPSMVTATIAGNLSDKIGGFKVLLLGLVLLALTATLPAMPGLPLWGEVCALVLFGGAQSFAMTPIVPIMGRYVSSKGSTAFASVYALFNLAYSVAILFGPSIAGVVFAQFGFFWLMASSAILLGLLVVPVVVVARYAGLE
ncbi:major facilitator superfamily domain-containing protein [Catenaria anguillulae PL171]|uniref:Major facilitator superfamily domain-containing protein n=1 Tax=Catenaria anguillulae PL171 TaxID=765915 RepID=A0A1Y2I1A3_9FUNG|nr:major facilitator superfamily domain-containing protein [Catenaria anguillulae PL171]